MKESLVISQHFSLDSSIIDEDTTVIIGFSGYGSVGRLVANHLAEAFRVTSIGYWGPVSWFHNDRLEAPITVFKLDIKSNDPQEKFVLVTSRLNVPVVGIRALPDVFWNSWNNLQDRLNPSCFSRLHQIWVKWKPRIRVNNNQEHGKHKNHQLLCLLLR